MPHTDGNQTLLVNSWGTPGSNIAIFKTPAGLNIYDGTVNQTTAVPTDGLWHYFVVVLGGGVIKLYVDGTQRTSDATTFTGATRAIELGNSPTWAGTGLIGWLDEVALYPTALTAAQIAAHYAAATGG
jgi:hypothetical protein